MTANTLYYVRAYAINSVGTAYGNEAPFTTLKALTIPKISTKAVTSISETSSVSGGIISEDGNAAITSRGVCWNINPTPTTNNTKTIDGSGIGAFTSSLSGLTANTLYYVRAYAINSVGTAYGNEAPFTTLQIFGASQN